MSNIEQLSEQDHQASEEAARRPSQATQLLALAHESDIELFHTATREGHVTALISGRLETFKLSGRMAALWLRQVWSDAGNAAVLGPDTIRAVLGQLESDAVYKRPELPLFTRLGACGDVVYLDLCDETGRAVEITAEGWRLLARPPVKFLRTPAMMTLPEPAQTGSLAPLRAMLNVRDEDWPLVVGWLFGTLAPAGPYPVLILHGQQGSAKSTTARLLISLVDPQRGLRTAPKDERDLFIGARNRRCLAYDNLSSIPVWLSDALCQIATEGAYVTRKLQTDDEEAIFQVQRPIVLTGIHELATRSDLLSRAILVELPPLTARATERELFATFNAERPRILGALLDAARVAMARRHQVPDLEDPPRMADFATWVRAAEPALGLQPGAFLDAYRGNVATANSVALEGSPLVAPLRRLLTTPGAFDRTLTASELLELFNGEREPVGGDPKILPNGWPKTPAQLSQHLKRLAPNLLAAGIAEVSSSREGRAADQRTKWAVRGIGGP